jgi:hypothetical protein
MLEHQLQVNLITDQLNDLKLYNKKKKSRNNHRKLKYRKSVPKALKDLLWDRTFGPEAGQGNCYVCGIVINSKRFEAGHIIAVCKGGLTNISNLRCICSTCNKSMGTQNLEKFKQKYFGDITVNKSDYFEKSNIVPVKEITNKDIKVLIFDNNSKNCWLCQESILGDYDLRKECDKYYHKKCWNEYFDYATQLFGRRETFLRKSNCPHCLDKKWKILDNFK